MAGCLIFSLTYALSRFGSWQTFLADLAATDSPAAWAAVPWALEALTAEFGMGSGGIPPLGPPGRQRTFARSRIPPGKRDTREYDTLLEHLLLCVRLVLFPDME